jgi:hypothetical protein
VLGNRAPLALGTKRVVDLGDDTCGVNVQCAVAAGILRVVRAQRYDGRLADEYDRAPRLLLDSGAGSIRIFELTLERYARGAPAFLRTFPGSSRVKREDDPLVDANLDRGCRRRSRLRRGPSERDPEDARHHPCDEPTP